MIEQLNSAEARALAALHEKGGDPLFKEVFSEHSWPTPPTLERQFAEHCKVAGLETDQSDLWLDNLLRLRLLEVRTFSEASYVEPEDGYGPRVTSDDIRYLSFTTFGREFVKACTPC